MSKRKNLDPAVVQAAKNGDLAARAAVLERMGPIVGAQASKLAIGTTYSIEDLVQAGMLGVLEALDTFDPAKGSFETYCWHPIRWAMSEEMSAGMGGPTVPRGSVKRYFKVLHEADGDASLGQEMAPEFGMSEEAFSAAHNAVTGSWSTASFTWQGDEDAFEIEDDMDLEQDVATRVLAEAMLDLLEDELDREIVSRAYGLVDGMPWNDERIGKLVGMSKSGVGLRRRKALLTMREG